MKAIRSIFMALCILLLGGPALAGDATTFTLYRDSLLDRSARLHIASFDTAEGESYNRENCNLVAVLMQEQPGVRTRFWCEKGQYTPE